MWVLNLNSHRIFKCFQATTYNGTVDGQTFKKGDKNFCSFARAKEVMNSKSPNDFRWSIRLNDDLRIYIGIASQLQLETTCIGNYDEYAILYCCYAGKICLHETRSKKIIDAIEVGSADTEIHFRFQPKLKKFSFSIVCKIIILCLWWIVCKLNFRKAKNMLSI